MKALVAIGLVVFGALGGWYVQHRALDRSRAEIAGVEAERDSAVVSAARLAAQNRFLRDSVREARASAARADSLAAEAVDEAHRRAQRAEAALRESLTEEQAATLDELLAAHRAEIAAIMSQLDAKMLVVERQARLIASQELEIGSWRAAYEAERAISRHWEREYAATQVVWRQPAFLVPVTIGLTVLGTLAVLN